MAKRKSLNDLRAIVGNVSFPNFTFDVVKNPQNEIYLQIKCAGTCTITKQDMTWKGRKWRLSRFMTKSELVQTCFAATMAAMEHEIREMFLYKDVSIFDPHYDVDKLRELRLSSECLDSRDFE